ncbi:hypothetical protein RB594_008074 [Gaeumannomyces avenae]
MQLSYASVLLALAAGAAAKLHSSAVCVKDRTTEPSGGSSFSPSYNWVKNYEILPDATKCACEHYKARNTGDNKWDKCPDCTFVCPYRPRHAPVNPFLQGIWSLTKDDPPIGRHWMQLGRLAHRR